MEIAYAKHINIKNMFMLSSFTLRKRVTTNVAIQTPNWLSHIIGMCDSALLILRSFPRIACIAASIFMHIEKQKFNMVVLNC